MSDNLKTILQACKKRGLPPGFFSKKAFDRTRKSAGLGEDWDNDILRHTYASHCWASKRDLNYLVKNMGNSEDVLKQSYLNEGVIASEGQALFEIRPAGISKSRFGAPTKPDRVSRRPVEATPSAV
jgi:hypothetical protein